MILAISATTCCRRKTRERGSCGRRESARSLKWQGRAMWSVDRERARERTLGRCNDEVCRESCGLRWSYENK